MLVERLVEGSGRKRGQKNGSARLTAWPNAKESPAPALLEASANPEAPF
jgi:hypothetical protein